MKKTKFLAVVALLAATGLLFFAGCRQSLSGPQNETRYGLLRVTIGEDVLGRAILPDVELSDFDLFRLDFTPNPVTPSQGPGMHAFHRVWAVNTDIIELEVGNWDLRVTAFKEDLLPTSPDPVEFLEGLTRDQALSNAVAVGTNATIIQVQHNQTALSVNISLDPIVAGYGTFSWDITFLPNAGVVTAQMEILPSTHTINILQDYYDDIDLAAGTYVVAITLTNNVTPPETVRIPQYLRVYQNLISHLEMEFELRHFPATLLNFILRLWSQTDERWLFQENDIDCRHFRAVDLTVCDCTGNDSCNFDDVVAQMNALTVASGPAGSPVLPTNRDTLGHLVDTALIAVAIADDEINPYDFYALVAGDNNIATAIRSFAENTDDANIAVVPVTETTDYAPRIVITLTTIIGAYSTDFVFDQLTGPVVITYSPDPRPCPTGTTYLHRVGDEMTAGIGGLIGPTGEETFQWVRSAAVYPAAAPAVPTDWATIRGTAWNNITDERDQDYTLASADVNRHVTVLVGRDRYFGRIVSTNMIGFVVYPPEEVTFTFQLNGFNGIDLDLTSDIVISIISNPPTVPYVLTASPEDTAIMSNIRWYIVSSTLGTSRSVGTGASLTLDSSVFGLYIGIHHLTVKADIAGSSYSRVITFRTTP